MQYYVILYGNLIQVFFYYTVSWFAQKFAETNWDDNVPVIHLGL